MSKDIEQFEDSVKRVSSILEKARNCSDAKQQLDNDIKKICQSKSFNKRYREIIVEEFENHASYIACADIIQEFSELFFLLYAKTKFQEKFQQCEQIYSQKAYELNAAISASKYLSSGLSWIFNSRQAKQKILDAKNTVNEFLYSWEAEFIETFFTELKEYVDPNKEELLKAFNSNAEEWFNIVNKYVGEQNPTNYLKETIELAKEIIDVIKIGNIQDNFQQQTEKYREQINTLVQKEKTENIDKEIVEEIISIPIEELNRDRAGLKIGILKQNGFNTVADVYYSPLQEISAIKGISVDMASQIRYRAKKIFKGIYDSKTKINRSISINYDNRNKNTSEIVTLAYCYKNLCLFYYKKLFVESQKLEKTGAIRQNNLQQILEILSCWDTDVGWIFFGNKIRTMIIKAYYYAKDLLQYAYFINLHEYKYYCLNINNISTEQIQNLAWEDFLKNTIDFYNAIEYLVPDAFSNDDNNHNLPEELVKKIEEERVNVDNLLCKLRNYQLFGVKYILHQKRVLLGDEMGLGKTIQSIAAMASLKSTGENYFVVICPASVIMNWFKECEKYSNLTVFVGHGRQRDDSVMAWKYHGGVLITTYETYPNLKLNENIPIGLVVVDEAHYIKNPDARRSVAVRALCDCVERVLFLTGTPIENKVDEMLSLIGCLNENVKIQAQQNALIHMSEKFAQIVAPVYLRRKQKDVNKELPEKIESIAWCQMTEYERHEYDMAVLNSAQPFMTMRRVSWGISNLKESSKAQMLKEIVDNAREEKRKVIVFSFFRDTIQKVFNLFEDECAPIINGSTSVPRRQEIIDEFSNNNDLVVLPAQIGAAGTGLNIQVASVVVLCEPQIKPSIEDQAIARAHRMGQNRIVLVYRLCCENSIDARILQLQDEKRKQFKAYADNSVAWEKHADLNSAEEKEIFMAELEAIKERNKNYVAYKNKEVDEWAQIQSQKEEQKETEIKNRGRRRGVTPSQRDRILRRYNYTCQKCGRYGPGARNKDGTIKPEPKGGYAIMEVDHKIPWSLGGLDTDENLWVLCDKCNGGKSNNYSDT